MVADKADYKTLSLQHYKHMADATVRHLRRHTPAPSIVLVVLAVAMTKMACSTEFQNERKDPRGLLKDILGRVLRDYDSNLKSNTATNNGHAKTKAN